VFLIGIAMGIGKAAVYKYIPEFFPDDVGVVGGIVGMLGGLGGFVCPIIFGFMLDSVGLWTTTWMFLFAVSTACLVWLTVVVRNMLHAAAPELATRIEDPGQPAPVTLRVVCPVHHVEARVRVVVGGGDQAVTVGACSLHPGPPGAVPCEGRCLVGDDEPLT
jgi:MFS family permease